MNFQTADRVGSVIEDMKQAEYLRAAQRALIQDLYNGVPPYTREEEDENNILVNINWKEGTNLLHQARRQYENAFLKPGNYFTIHLDSGPTAKRGDWSRTLTRLINRPLKRPPHGLPFMEAYRSKFAGVVLSGVGPMAWEDKWKWLPYTFGIEDLLTPTDTYTTLENLYYFAIRRPMKPGALFRKTLGRKNADPGWDLDAVKMILNSYRDLNQNPHQWNWSEHPEKMAELYKQNGTYFDGDSAPVIWFWDFYFQQEESEGGKWARRLMLDQDQVQGDLSGLTSPIRFIYSKEDFADELGQILHVQLGDGNNKPPFMLHAVRSIGWILFDVVQMMNRLRCQFTEHVFEQMMMIFMVNDPADRARLEKIIINNKGIIPEGARILPAAERYTIDANLVNNLMSENKQLMSETTAAYTQDIDDGTRKEKTATEVMAQVNSLNSLAASLITYAYMREAYAYREICRRFCIKNSPDPDVQRFHQECDREGIPEEMRDVSRWEVEPERVLGGGNKVLEVATAQQLRSLRPDLDPDAQREVDRIFIGAVTDDEKLAARLVPDKRSTNNEATHDAELAFGTLMQGVPMQVRSGLNHEDQVQTLLKLMGLVIKRIQATGNMGTPGDVIGLNNVAQYVAQHLRIMAEDKMEKKKTKNFAKILGQMMNLVKAFAQRQQAAAQKAQQQQQQDPQAMAKIQMDAMSNRVKLAGKEASDRQKLQHKELAFRSDQQRKNMETAAGIQRDRAETASNITNRALESAARAAATPRAFEDEE